MKRNRTVPSFERILRKKIAMNYQLIRVGVCLVLILAGEGICAQKLTTQDDTLRGTITAERNWWDVGYYRLKIAIDPDEQKISGSVMIVYKVLEAGQRMQIDLQPPLSIDKVRQGGKDLTFSKKGKNAHIIRIDKNQVPEATDSIEVFYSGHPIIARNPPWEGGFQFAKDRSNNWFIATSCQGLGASAWWPNKDHSYDEPDSMLMIVTVPEPLTDISNGRLRKVTSNGDSTRTFEWFVKNPINNYGVNVNAATYKHFADTLMGEKGLLTMDFYVLPYNFEKAREQFKQAKLMLKAFEYWFGPYPFYEDGYKLVETPYLGMEHQSSVTYGNGYQNGYRGKDPSGTGWGLKWDFIIIHESGHEWFANNITYKDIADMWIHESFANYSETLFTEFYYGKEAGTDYNVGIRKGIQNDRPIIGTYNVNKSGSGDMYPKGGNMLHTIRHSINDDEKFRNILRGLNETFYHKTVTSKEIEDFISSKAAVDFSKVFDQYLRDVRVPVLEYKIEKGKLHYRWANAVDGFDLGLHQSSMQAIKFLKPGTKWQTMSFKKREQPIDKQYLERMYYISVKDLTVSNPRSKM
jgi:aminopeptidase N